MYKEDLLADLNIAYVRAVRVRENARKELAFYNVRPETTPDFENILNLYLGAPALEIIGE